MLELNQRLFITVSYRVQSGVVDNIPFACIAHEQYKCNALAPELIRLWNNSRLVNIVYQ